MRISTVLNHQQRIGDRLAQIYASAVYSRPTHVELYAEVQTLWADPTFAKLPGWCRSVLYDRQRQYAKQIYSHLRWAFIGLDGDGTPQQLDALSEADRQRVFRDEIKGQHYWLTPPKAQSQWLPDGTYRETVSRRLTAAYY